MSEINLNKQQKEAVEYLGGPLLVLAGPGTGKTQLLSSKVAYILENTDANPENILCITFTENGAMNMRERLLRIIGQAAYKVNIHTYHSFGGTILDQYKNYAEVLTRGLDNPVDEVFQYKIIKEIQEELPALDILKAANPKDIVSTISSAKSARLTAEDLEQIARVNIEESVKLSEELAPFFEKLVPRMKYKLAIEEVYGPILETLSQHDESKPILKNIDHMVKELALDLAEAVTLAEEAEKLGPLSDWKKKYFELDDNGNNRLNDRVANKKLLSFASIMKKYQERLEEQNLFDFADMIEEAAKFLREDQGFRLTLSEQYQYLLLDEFQDTNPSQFELIKLLTDYESPAVMAVGDDDQAIFEFQGANASNLSDFKNHYEAKVVNLVENYRSMSEILDFGREIADKVPDSFAKKHNVNKILRSFKSLFGGEEVKVNISRHEFLSADAEYYWVAEQVEDLIKNGAKKSEIAIITPKHKYIAPLLPYLKARNINIAYEKKDNLFEEPKLKQLLTLAEFVDDLGNGRKPAHKWLEILAFPFWDIPRLLAIKVTEEAGENRKSTLDYLLKVNDPKLNQVASFIAGLATAAFDAPLELFLDYLIGTAEIPDLGFRSPFLDYYAKADEDYKTFELYENLQVLREGIIRHTNAQNPKLKDLIEFLKDYREAGAALINTSPYQDSSDAVQVLTSHKAKGLEFEHVFLVAVDNNSWGKGKGNNNMFSLPKNLTQIRHTGVTDSERLRLLFVAITRAKSNLIMTNSIKDFSGKTPKRLEYLEEFAESDDKLISPLLPKKTREVVLHYSDLEEAKKQTDLRASWISSYQELTPDMRELLKARVKNYRLTASDLVSFVDIVYAGPLTFFKQRILRAPKEPAGESIIIGNILHKTFEYITKEKASGAAAEEFLKKIILEDRGVTEDKFDYYFELGLKSLNANLEKFGDLLYSKKAKAEVGIFGENISFRGVPIVGVVDHIEIDEKDKTIEIYDLKTGKYSDTKNWWKEASLLRYMLQLNFYKILLKASPTYKNYKVLRGHILFIRPDHDNIVYDRVYDFNEKDEQIISDLIEAIYSQIKSLAFLEDKELAIEPDVERNYNDISDFIEKILDKNREIV